MPLTDSPTSTNPTETGDTRLTTELWNAREQANPTATLVYESSDHILLAFDTVSEAPVPKDSLEDHYENATSLASAVDVTLPDADAFVVLENTFDRSWDQPIAEKYAHPLAPLEYEIRWFDPRWDQYEASISASAAIPGAHGTLQKELRLQGFATHRDDASDTVTIHETLTHRETDHVFYEDDETEFETFQTQSKPSYPLVPSVRMGVYNSLFSDAKHYDSLHEEHFVLCDRCGIIDDAYAESGLPVRSAPHPDGGWQRDYCTQCYAHAIRDSYDVLPEIAEMYVAYQRGATYTEIADEYDTSEEYVLEMVDRVDDAVQTGGDF